MTRFASRSALCAVAVLATFLFVFLVRGVTYRATALPTRGFLMADSDVPSPDPDDPYRWLEDNASARSQAWLQGQAAHAEAYFRRQKVRDALRDEFRDLYSLDTVGMPHPHHDKYFSWRRRGGEDLSVLYVQDSLTGPARVVIDQNTLSPDKTTRLASWNPSRDATLLAYGLTTSGNDRHDLRVKSLATGQDLPDVIPDDGYPDFRSWDVYGKGFWYTRHDPRMPPSEAKLHQRLYFHRLGTPWQEDELVFGEQCDKEAIIGASLSASGNFLLISVYGQDKATGQEWSETFIRHQDDPTHKLVRVLPRRLGVEQHVYMHRDLLYLRTDHEAPNGKLLATDQQSALAGRPDWKVILPEGPYKLESVTHVSRRLFVETLENVHSALKVYTDRGVFVREIPLPGLGYLNGVTASSNGKELFYSYNSFAVPDTVYRLDLRTYKQKEISRVPVRFDTDQIETEQVWYLSKDGTRVPMFIVHRRGLKLDGNNPTVLYGYGGFDISLTPGFNKGILPFLSRGGVYVVANLRGGGEFGKAWHEAGTKTNKQNVFDDFAWAAKWLIENRYTRPERLAVMGGSNGGLLTLVTAVQHPQLVKAVISQVPVADMLRFHLFFGGVYWIPDYGDPDDPAMRQYLRGYSPYHNVRDGEKYPAILITTSDGDDRVHPMHSYKMAARLLEANASANPILLRVELKAGHGGAGAISKWTQVAADEWCFIFDQLGVK